MIGKGAVQGVVGAKRMGAIDFIEMAVPDVNGVAAGKEGIVALHLAHLRADFVRRVVVVIVKADDVLAFSQLVEFVSFFTEIQPLRAVDITHIVHARIDHHGDQIFVALRGIVEDHQLAFIGRIVLILKEIEQIGQERPALPRRTDHADKREFGDFFLLLAFEQRLHQISSHLIAAAGPVVVLTNTARRRRQ